MALIIYSLEENSVKVHLTKFPTKDKCVVDKLLLPENSKAEDMVPFQNIT